MYIVLPAKLSPSEEKDLLHRLNKDEDSTVKTRLIEGNLRLVQYVVNKYSNSGLEGEDMFSIGSMGLMKAVNSFDTSRNIKFATYAVRCIENEIFMSFRKVKRRRSEASIDDPISQDSNGNYLYLSDLLPSDDVATQIHEDIENLERTQAVHSAISSLGDRNKYIMELRYGLSGKEPMTQKEVSEQVGLSQSYISRLEKKVLLSLRPIVERHLKED